MRCVCTWIRGEKSARLYTSLDIIKIPNLIQCSVLTLNYGVDSSGSPKSCIDCSSSVCGTIGRDNPSSREELLLGAQLANFSQYQQGHLTNLIRREAFEEIDRLLKKGDNLLLRDIIGVTAGFQSADASSMLPPFVRPETLVIALVVFPVGVHITE